MKPDEFPSGYTLCTDPRCEANQMPVNLDGTAGFRHAHPDGSTWQADRDAGLQEDP